MDTITASFVLGMVYVLETEKKDTFKDENYYLVKNEKWYVLTPEKHIFVQDGTEWVYIDHYNLQDKFYFYTQIFVYRKTI